MLNKTFRKLAVSASAIALALTASASWAQSAPTVCTGVADPDITIAVASNFYVPAQDVVAMFQATEAGDGKVIEVCHNSTGLLVTEINGGNPKGFSLFLAANNTAPSQLTVTTIGLAKTYALGVPVLWSYTVPTSQLMSNGIINNPPVTSLAIGNPAPAPYGKAAKAILEDLGQWETPGDPPSTFIPGDTIPPPRNDNDPVLWITQYANIDITEQAIAFPNSDDGKAHGSNVAGFVSKTQVCRFLPLPPEDPNNPPVIAKGIVEFPGFSLIQQGILINTGDTDKNALADAFFDYLLDDEAQDFLVSQHCYAAP